MISLKDIPNIIQRMDSKLQVVNVYDFSMKEWLVGAYEDPTKQIENQPMYLVSKRNGSITPFVPTQDLKGFSRAIRHRVAGL